jgi:hypothetical protein
MSNNNGNNGYNGEPGGITPVPGEPAQSQSSRVSAAADFLARTYDSSEISAIFTLLEMRNTDQSSQSLNRQVSDAQSGVSGAVASGGKSRKTRVAKNKKDDVKKPVAKRNNKK